MPELRFTVRWPDGGVDSCYSPSTIIRDYFEVGRSYSIAEFLAASRAGLNAASERVRALYGGSGCSLAKAQLAAIEAKLGRQTDANAQVRIEGFQT